MNIIQKLSTPYIRQEIVKRVDKVNYLSLDASNMKIAQNVSSWKRNSKQKLKNAINDYGVSSVQEFLECGDETELFCKPNSITEKCIVRHFVIADLTLDCTCITDETDQNILVFIWHQD